MLAWNIASGVVLGLVATAVLRWVWRFVRECLDQTRADDDAIARLNLKQLHYVVPSSRPTESSDFAAPPSNPEEIATARRVMDSTRRMVEQGAAGVAIVLWQQRRARRVASIPQSLPTGGGLSATQLAAIVSATIPERGSQVETATEARERHVRVLEQLALGLAEVRRAAIDGMLEGIARLG